MRAVSQTSTLNFEVVFFIRRATFQNELYFENESDPREWEWGGEGGEMFHANLKHATNAECTEKIYIVDWMGLTTWVTWMWKLNYSLAIYSKKYYVTESEEAENSFEYVQNWQRGWI